MSKPLDPDNYQRTIASLERKLEEAYLIIDELRRQNAYLREQLEQSPRNPAQQSTVLQRDIYSTPSPHPRKQTSTIISNYGQYPVKSRWGKWQFTIQVSIVVLVVTGAGLLWMHRLNGSKSQIKPSAANRPVVTDLPKPLSFSPDNSSGNPIPLLPQQSGHRKNHLALKYNVTVAPRLKKSDKLQEIVNEAVKIAELRRLPTNSISISLINVKTGEIAGYQESIPRYPASISKMFWMVALYAQVEKGILPEQYVRYDNLCKTDICRMVQKSDNESASRIIDIITDTESSANLKGEDYKNWLAKRNWLNQFFQAAGYENINISQKNFPIPYLKMDEPQGSDLQMRGDNPSKPVRNQMTVEHAARLMYEIFTAEALSQKASENMIQLLTRDLRPEVWKQEQYNSVEGFLGESLPVEQVYFASKVGWTLKSRQEAAYVSNKDGSTDYILVIFGDDAAYGDDWKIFPEISDFIYKRMVELGGML